MKRLIRALLRLLFGIMGGIYIVPLNTCLRHEGHRSVGAYTLASTTQITPGECLSATGIALLLMVTYLFFYSRRPQQAVKDL